MVLAAAVAEEEGSSMVDCCLLFLLILPSSCMWCLLCVCVVFFVGSKVALSSDLIVSGTCESLNRVPGTNVDCRVLCRVKCLCRVQAERQK